MKKMLYSCLFIIMNLNSLYSCEEDDNWDTYYIEECEPVEWEGHLWIPLCLEHSSKCPCLSKYEIKD